MIQRMKFDIDRANEKLAQLSAIERLSWIIERFGKQAVLLGSMQKTASVLIHMLYELGFQTEVLFVDTGFHFHETLKLRDEYMRKYHTNLITLYPQLTPEEQETKFGKKLHLFQDGQPECCRLRKEVPFVSYMKVNDNKAVLNGRLTSEGNKRSELKIVTADPRIDGYAIHPIIDWTKEQVLEYIDRNDVPVNELHAQSYPSIGCACCTTQVMEGEDERAGRWRRLRQDDDGPMYCGINFSDGSGI